ncbi:MAG: thioredoxin domain-containing protein [Deltaproteobacteria bacterium]|nr:thioredoxin domain-containing protein [Deltaproteobacteria bacterium]
MGLALLLALLCPMVAVACSKRTPDVHVAQAAPAPTANANTAEAPKGAAADDETPPPGIDLSSLDSFERKVFFRVVNKEASACGKAHSLMFSLKNDPGCRKSFYAARYVARLVEGGFTDSEVTEAVDKRFRNPTVVKLDPTGAPIKGSSTGRVTLVEFVDYECPHCKRVQPVLRQVVDEFPNDVRVVMKHYPLSQHTNARLAATAAVAAHMQGKFWPYSEKVWENSEFLTPALLEKLAKDVGLDVTKWRKDSESEAANAIVEKDKAQGGAAGIRSTPTIYINGKLFTDSRDVESLRDWITEELGR